MPYEGFFLLQLSQKQRTATAAPFEGPPCAGEAFEPPAPRKGGQQVGDGAVRGFPLQGGGSWVPVAVPVRRYLCSAHAKILSVNGGKKDAGRHRASTEALTGNLCFQKQLK